MAKAPKLINSVLSHQWYDKFSRATIGYIDTPILSVPTLAKQVSDKNYKTFDLAYLKNLNVEQQASHVLIVQDPFTSFYDANVVEAMMALIEKLGFTPILLPFKPNGKPQHVKGFLAKFAKTAKNTSEFLNELHQLNIPMVGLDASLTLCYRDEYKQTLGDKRGDFHVLLAHEWLLTVIAHQNTKTALSSLAHKKQAAPYKLFAHCTEKTALAGSEGQWREIFKLFGLTLENVSVGCCGMAGTYGHEQVNFENSKMLFEMSWQNKLAALEAKQVLVTGYSCRSQTKRLGNMQTRHPVEALLSAFD
jgi:Fe-S oxidoreductase